MVCMTHEKLRNPSAAIIPTSVWERMVQSRAVRGVVAPATGAVLLLGPAACGLANPDHPVATTEPLPSFPPTGTSSAEATGTSSATTSSSAEDSSSANSPAETTSAQNLTTAAPSSSSSQPATPVLRGITVEPDQSKLGSNDFQYMYNGYDVVAYASPTGGSTPLNVEGSDPLSQPHIRYGDNAASRIVAYCFVTSPDVGLEESNGHLEYRWAAYDNSQFVGQGGMQTSAHDIAYASFATLNSKAEQLPGCDQADDQHNPAHLSAAA